MEIIKSVFNAVAGLRPSSIEFVTSAGVELNASEEFTVGFAFERIQLKDNRTSQTRWLAFQGAGGGIGVGTPVGGSVSKPSFPSSGSKVLRGLTNIGTLELSDLTIGSSQIWAFSAEALAGVSGSLIFFGNNLPPPMPPVIFKAALWIEGICISSPGAGCMTYYGIWTLQS